MPGSPSVSKSLQLTLFSFASRSPSGQRACICAKPKCRLFPQQRTFTKAAVTSALCHERTWTCYSITPCVRLVPENEFGISEQEPKPNRRHDNQADRRDEIPKAILGHRQRYRDRTTPQLNSLINLDADAAGEFWNRGGVKRRTVVSTAR